MKIHDWNALTPCGRKKVLLNLETMGLPRWGSLLEEMANREFVQLTDLQADLILDDDLCPAPKTGATR